MMFRRMVGRVSVVFFCAGVGVVGGFVVGGGEGAREVISGDERWSLMMNKETVREMGRIWLRRR